MLAHRVAAKGPTVHEDNIGSASATAASRDSELSVSTIPAAGERPRSTRSRLDTTNVCCAVVNDANPDGRTSFPTPSLALALLMAVTIASVQRWDEAPFCEQVGQ